MDDRIDLKAGIVLAILGVLALVLAAYLDGPAALQVADPDTYEPPMEVPWSW